MIFKLIVERILLLDKKILCRKFSNRNLQTDLQVPRRALLYVPGNDDRKINKTLSLDVDSIVLDCEDGVALNKKKVARETIRKFLDAGKPSKSRNYDWGVRVNSVSSELIKDDLDIILGGPNFPDTILLPKVQSVKDLEFFSNLLNTLVRDDRRVNLIIYIESAMAMINLVDICNKATDLSHTSKFSPVALVFGSDDLCANIGATRSADSSEILYARQKLVLVAKAFNLQAIDMVHIEYKDLDGLRKNSEEGARMGYNGKQVIHPDQVPVVHEAFIPSKRRIEWAEGLISAFNEHQHSGTGAFVYRGSMIDMPTMRQAQNVINLLKSI